MKINVVIVGHVDHGKSTLIGRLLYDSDSITEGRVEEIQKLAEEYKRRFEFAYFIDSFDDELKEERTIDTTGVMFKGKNLYVITDVPGHKEFIKNMLSGASHSDVAVLVVSAKDGIGEQTGRHAFLIHMLGIKQIFVIVNKMDAISYNENAYRILKDEVCGLLSVLGIEAKEFIPASERAICPNMRRITLEKVFWSLDEMSHEIRVPEDIRVETLDDYQTGELKRLKDWLYRQRVKVRQERERGDRRLEREETEVQRKAEQPALFDF